MNDRLSPPPENEHCEAFQISSFEVSFAQPVWITGDDQDKFHRLFDGIVRKPWNQFKDGVHWLAGAGSKPNWSQADSYMLGKPVDLQAPVSGSPTFSEEVFYMETAAREFIDEEERQKVEKRRDREARKGRGDDDVLDMMRDEFMRIGALCANHPDDAFWQEVAGICRRAKNTIEQKVPVVVQRDKLEDRMAAMRNSVVVACTELPNVAEYIAQLEKQRDSAQGEVISHLQDVR